MSRSPISPAPAPSGRSSCGRPRRAGPASRQRDADRSGDRAFRERAPATILDLGTGPGTLLLAALDQWPEARGLGVDASEAGAGLCPGQCRAPRHGGARRIPHWATGRRASNPFDLILANPPYIGTERAASRRKCAIYEPGSALFAGIDGLDDYRRIIPDLPRLLAPGGAAILEIGWTQAKRSPRSHSNMDCCPASPDLGNRPRAVLLT
jgi:release factor glutamine methyltransferase